MNIPEGCIKVDPKDLWPAYIEYMKGKGPNPFLQCGCITPKVTVYPPGYNPRPEQKRD